jgi:polyhydroxyalkanoate synthesis regulator phasin
MPESDQLRRYLDAGVAFTQLTRDKAEKIVKDLVRQGELSREQASARVEELLERSRTNTDAMLGVVRKEIDARVAQLNLVPREELANLASRLGVKVPGAKAAAKKAPAKKASATKAPAKKALVKKAPVKKAAVTKAPAKKAPVKKAAPSSTQA